MSAVFTSRQFNQNPSAVKRATANGPVFVTERGADALVVLKIEDYRRIVGGQPTLYERVMSLPHEGFEIEFDPPRMSGFGARPAEFD